MQVREVGKNLFTSFRKIRQINVWFCFVADFRARRFTKQVVIASFQWKNRRSEASAVNIPTHIEIPPCKRQSNSTTAYVETAMVVSPFEYRPSINADQRNFLNSRNSINDDSIHRLMKTRLKKKNSYDCSGLWPGCSPQPGCRASVTHFTRDKQFAAKTTFSDHDN